MIGYKYILSLSGDKFDPYQKNEFFKKFNTQSLFSCKELNVKGKEYGFGNVSILHPNNVCLDEEKDAYETWFVNWLEMHMHELLDCFIDEIEIFMEIFYTDQCNTEVFNQNLIQRLSKFNVTLPLSVYQISEKDLKDFANG